MGRRHKRAADANGALRRGSARFLVATLFLPFYYLRGVSGVPCGVQEPRISPSGLRKTTHLPSCDTQQDAPFLRGLSGGPWLLHAHWRVPRGRRAGGRAHAKHAKPIRARCSQCSQRSVDSVASFRGAYRRHWAGPLPLLLPPVPYLLHRGSFSRTLPYWHGTGEKVKSWCQRGDRVTPRALAWFMPALAPCFAPPRPARHGAMP